MMLSQKTKLKNQNYSSKFKSFYFLFALLTFNFLLFTLPVYAAESTPSADIQSKLKALQSEIASRAAKLTAEVNKKLQNRSYVGVLKSKSDASLSLTTRTGLKSVILNEYTQYTLTAKDAALKNFSVKDYIAALGDVDENGVLTAKRVIKLKADNTDKRILWGKVISIDRQNITLQNQAGSKTDQTIRVKTTSDTIFKFGKVAASILDLKEGKAVVVVGSKDNDSSVSARLVYILPYVSYAHFKSNTPVANTASPSAKIASPSVKEATSSTKIIKR